jgi:ornithine decarboxylase antizyme 1
VTSWIVSVIGTRPGQRGIPDVPNAAAVLTSKVSAEGGSVGRRVLASRHNESTIKSSEISQKFANDNNTFDGDENFKKKNDQLYIFTDEHDLLWSIKLRNDSLYVELPQQLNEESKEKFVSLLEFADDRLHCKHVIVYFDKTRPDRAALVKTFMFLGFHILSPDNILMNNNDKDQDKLYMVYIIDSDG